MTAIRTASRTGKSPGVTDGKRTGRHRLTELNALDWMACPYFTVETGKTLEIDLSAYTCGYDNPSYSGFGRPPAQRRRSRSKLSVTLDESVFGGHST